MACKEMTILSLNVMQILLAFVQYTWWLQVIVYSNLKSFKEKEMKWIFG